MLTERFDAALLFASALHRRQVRKETDTPYLTHLLAVAGLVAENGGSEDEAIAGLLHDAIEDQGNDYPGGRRALCERIKREFGEPVLEIVEGCTDDEGHEKGKAATHREECERWRVRKQAYLNHLKDANDQVRRVSCADKLHNLRTILADYHQIADEVWKRFRTGRREDQVWYYGELVRVFQETNSGPLADQLKMAYESLLDAIARQPENAMRAIFPYKKNGVWMFDDDATGLKEEPFVEGAPEMIDTLVSKIKDAGQGFVLYFSDGAFPQHQMKLDWVREEAGGNWYKMSGTDRVGWLCPAMFKYFSTAPAAIYCKAEPRRSAVSVK
jgi:hypothetical protein